MTGNHYYLGYVALHNIYCMLQHIKEKIEFNIKDKIDFLLCLKITKKLSHLNPNSRKNELGELGFVRLRK